MQSPTVAVLSSHLKAHLPLMAIYAVVSCADPGKVEHSRRVLSGPHFTVGSTIQYICSKGFTLSGNSLLTCFDRGSTGPKWNQKLPRCLRMYDLNCLSRTTQLQQTMPLFHETATFHLIECPRNELLSFSGFLFFLLSFNKTGSKCIQNRQTNYL